MPALHRFKLALILAALFMAAFSASAYRELFRADFNDQPPGALPRADYGTISSQSVAVVHYQDVFFPDGMAANWMRFNPTSSFAQVWTFAETAGSGECTLMWRMHLSDAYPPGLSSIAISPMFRALNGVIQYPVTIDFRTNGIIAVDFDIADGTWSPGVVHNFAFTVDLTTGAYTMWDGTNRIASGHTFHPIAQGMQFEKARLVASSLYTGTIDIDNIYAYNSRPFVSYGWMDFEKLPILGTLSEGPNDGYPLGDRVTGVLEGDFDQLDVVNEANSKRLRVRNNDSSRVEFRLTNVVETLPEGYYRLTFDYRQAQTNGNLFVEVRGNSLNKSVLEIDGDTGLVGINSNFVNNFVPFSLIPLNPDETVKFQLHHDTLSNTHSLAINGVTWYRDFPDFLLLNDQPSAWVFRTPDDPTAFTYLDNVSVERRGGQRIIAHSSTPPVYELYSFRPGSRQAETHYHLPTNFFPRGLTLGRDGLLYMWDTVNQQIAVHDPHTFERMQLQSYPSWFRPLDAMALADGRLAVMAESNVSSAALWRIEPYPSLALDPNPLITGLPINTDQVETSPDKTHLYILEESFPATTVISEYSAITFAKTREITAGAILGDIFSFHVSADGSVIASGTGSVRVVSIDPVLDEVRFQFPEDTDLKFVQDITSMPNGDILLTYTDDTFGRFNRHNGEFIARYGVPGEPAIWRYIVATPGNRIRSLEPHSPGIWKMDVSSGIHRYLDVQYSSSVTGTWITASGGNLVTTRTDTLHFDNPGSHDMRYFRTRESGWD